MKKLGDKDWICEYCGTSFVEANGAAECETSHDLVYVPIPRAQIYNLVRYFETNDVTLLPEQFIRFILDFARKSKSRL